VTFIHVCVSLKWTYINEWIIVLNTANICSKTMSIQNANVQRLHVETVHSVVCVAALQCCDHQSINY